MVNRRKQLQISGRTFLPLETRRPDGSAREWCETCRGDDLARLILVEVWKPPSERTPSTHHQKPRSAEVQPRRPLSISLSSPAPPQLKILPSATRLDRPFGSIDLSTTNTFSAQHSILLRLTTQSPAVTQSDHIIATFTAQGSSPHESTLRIPIRELQESRHPGTLHLISVEITTSLRRLIQTPVLRVQRLRPTTLQQSASEEL